MRRSTKMVRRCIRHWRAASCDGAAQSLRDQTNGLSYARPKLPSCLVTPAVPTVLPFHTFTYPLSPRQIRLICHRIALRISQSTLTQMWMPDVVYPPPSPPSSKINIATCRPTSTIIHLRI